MKKRLLILASSILILALTGCHSHAFGPATCEMPASCTECGETEGVALGHNYTTPTCEKPATCTRCGTTNGKALGHKWEDATCDKAKTCSVCGKEDGKPSGHDYAKATCAEAAKCNICGNTLGRPLAHDYAHATCTEAAKCNMCGKTSGEPRGHYYSEGSCTEDKKCKTCGDIIPAPGHDFTAASCDEPKRCNICGETKGKALGHDMVGGKCSRCGYNIGTVDSIKSIAGLKATCETNYTYCVVDADCDPSKGNPYDVTYDYGPEYAAYVDSCDWSLIYDHDYYVKTYPILAKLYHNDKRLLLEHFQTVGIHEGRQASSSFSISAYMDNCPNTIKNAFGSDYAAYAIYYMLNYSTEKKSEHLKLANGKTPAKQQKVVLTIMQAKEFLECNNYRTKVNAQELIIDPELCAFANYRAWINAHDDWAAHDWAKQHKDKVWDLLNTMSASSVAENTVTVHRKLYCGEAKYENYRNSKEHYEAMVRTKYNYFGTSHFYNSVNENLNNDQWKGKLVASTFDCFTDKADTAYN